jgi:tetratricopeptide (TPR) repeat protein
MIEAISGLWLLAFAVVLLVFLVLFRGPLGKVLEKFTRFDLEKGDAKLSVEQRGPDQAEEIEQQSEALEAVMPEAEEPEQSEEVSETEPTTVQGWVTEMLVASAVGDTERLSEAYRKAQDAEDDAAQHLRTESLYWRLRYEQGDTSAFDKLQELVARAEKNPEALPTIYNHIGMAYEIGNDYFKAAEAFDTAAEATSTETSRAQYAVSVARCLFAAGQRKGAFERLANEISDTSTPSALSRLYKGLATLYDKADDPELRAIALEKAIEYSPNDKDLRFYAGYAYAGSGIHTLAFMHYRTLLEFESENAAALNNIGLLYGHLKCPSSKLIP